MRFRQFKKSISEAAVSNATDTELEGMKAVLSAKIKQLPNDDATAKALKEVEELLQHVNAGGRMGMIYDQLSQINDPVILASQKLISRYILSIDSTPEERKEFFQAWEADKIVNLSALLSKERVSFDKVFNLYKSNNLVTEFIDDIMEVNALGQGKGEFGLNVLSKSIWKPEDGKGDLKVKVGRKVLQVECKTTQGGAARFSDQEVRPAEGFESAAIELNKFVKTSPTYPLKLPEYGLNLNKAIEFYQNVTGKEKTKFLSLVEKVIRLIFGNNNSSAKDVDAIINAFKTGNSKAALQSWATASFNYYMGHKEDDGVLYTNLNEKSFVFYTQADDLKKQHLRFHSSTPYLTTVKDPGRGVYPQLEVIPTTFGSTVASKELPKIAKQQAVDPADQFYNKLYSWSQALASARGVSDPATIKGITDAVQNMLAQRISTPAIVAQLETMFPALQVNTAA